MFPAGTFHTPFRFNPNPSLLEFPPPRASSEDTSFHGVLHLWNLSFRFGRNNVPNYRFPENASV